MTVLAHPGRQFAGLTGTGELARLAVRRDRIGMAAAVYVITAGVAGTAYTFKKLYPTAAGRAAFAVTGDGNPALRFLYGRLYGSSLGSLTAWRYGVWAGIFVALLAIFVVIRHTRSDEEASRLELVGSAVVGRQAALVAGLVTAATGVLATSVLLCVALPLVGLPAAGSAALALGIGCCGLAFTGITAVAAQLTSSARTARGIALAMLGVAFVLRGVGDSAGASGPSWLSWASPLAWIQLARPFAAPRWWVLLFPLALAAAGTGLAFALAARRDLDAGLLPDRPGRATASAFLHGPFGLAWRLQRGALLGWATGYAFTLAACGAAAKGIGQLFGTSTALEREFTRIGGQAAITNAYLAALMLLAGLVAAAYAVSVILRLRTEETSQAAEPVLAAATGRIRWALSHIAVAVGGAALLLAVAGVAAGLGYGLRTGSAGPGGPDDRRGPEPAAGRPGAGGPGRRPARAAAPGLGGRSLDRAGPGRGHRPVRRGAPAIPLDPGHLAVHPRPPAARRHRVGRSAGLAVPHRARLLGSRPGRPAPPRYRLTGAHHGLVRDGRKP